MAFVRSSLLWVVAILLSLCSALAAENDFILHQLAKTTPGLSIKLASYDAINEHVVCLKESQLSRCALIEPSGNQISVQ